MKLQIYLDTSVISACVDDRMRERQKDTEELFHRLGEYEVSISELTLTEIENTRDEEKRNQMSRIISPFQVLEITDEMRKLREIYLKEEVFSPASIDDALHVACAVISRVDILVSWNFRHLVRRTRRALINEVNIRHGFRTIEIVSPPEI
jgi:predicted nucleic acid-binding protein